MNKRHSSRLPWLLAFGLSVLSVWADPVRTAVFCGNGPRGRGCVEWFRLVAASPELELKLVDARMIRQGALDDAAVLVVPGGSSVEEKKDLGPEGVEKIRAFIRNGGGYVGTCAGCSLLLDAQTDPARGIGVIPYRRIGSKGGATVPIALNGAGARAMGVNEGVYKVRYHAGPILEPSTNAVADAAFETWATYDSDFDCPKTNLTMYGKIALVGGTFGKGRVFAITCHPEANVATYGLVKGAFRYVLGREVTFPARPRRERSLTVGMFASGISGLETAKTVVALDAIEGVDFFPLTADEICGNWLDRVDCLVFPGGNAAFYKKSLTADVRRLIAAYDAAGGKSAAWGCGKSFAPKGARTFESGARFVEAVRESQKILSTSFTPLRTEGDL